MKDSRVILAEVISSESSFSAAAPSVHPLGFIRLGLSLGETHYRVHVWGALNLQTQDSEFLVHDHNFGFTSVCVLGAVETRRWEVSFGDRAKNRSVFEITYSEAESRMTRVGECHAAPEAWIQQCEGDRYSISVGDFHEARVKSDIAATVVDVTTAVERRPRVLGPLKAFERKVFSRHFLTKEQSIAARAAVLKALGD